MRIIRRNGGKGKCIPSILAHMPQHTAYIEPFAGTAALLMAKEPSPVEIINDVDSLMINFFRVLKYQGEALSQRIEATPWSRALFKEWCRRLGDEQWVNERVSSGEKTGVGDLFLAEIYCNWSWQAINTRKGCKEWSISQQGASELSAYRKVPFYIQKMQERMRFVQIEQRDAFVLIERYKNDTSCFFFCDPPYIKEVCGDQKRHYKEWYSTEEHEWLLSLIATAKAKIMISSYPNEIYDRYLQGWNRFDVETNAMSNLTLRQGYKKIERFWYNYDMTKTLQQSLF